MRVAIISDQHICESSRFDETQRLLSWIANDLAERDVDLILLGGDLFDRQPSPIELTVAADWFIVLGTLAPVVGVRGNHDPLHVLGLMPKLRTRHPIIIEEAAAVHEAAGAAVACLSWPRKAQLLALAGARAQEETGQLAQEVLRDVLRGLGGELARHQGPRILLAHAMVSGSVTSTGQPLVGVDLELGLADLALAGADLVALGHIHKAQDWTNGDVPMLYPGSPRRTAFGEVEPKGYVVAELTNGAVRWLFIPTPATPMVLLAYQWCADGFLVDDVGRQLHENDIPNVRGAEVRLRYEVDADQRDAARAGAGDIAAWLDARGAVSVKVEEQVRATTRARAPEVAEAKTLAEKLRAFWKARGIELAEDRQQRVLGRLVELEEAA